MPLDRCLKCDCKIKPDPLWRLCEQCRVENWGGWAPDGNFYAPAAAGAEDVWLEDVRDMIDPNWRINAVVSQYTSMVTPDQNDYERMQRIAENGHVEEQDRFKAVVRLINWRLKQAEGE